MKNFIFDIGNVLVAFHPREYLEGMFEDCSVRDALLSLVFGSEEWIELDRGTLTHEQATSIFMAKRPDLAIEIARCMAHITDMLTPIDETIALLPGIKAAGHRLFYLSNYHTELTPYILEHNECFKLFDGGVFSCDVHLIKPDLAIYERLLHDYSLSASDCLFFDDMQVNIDAACRAGIQGVLFTGAHDVAQHI